MTPKRHVIWMKVAQSIIKCPLNMAPFVHPPLVQKTLIAFLNA
jgi:hypothetical protein